MRRFPYTSVALMFAIVVLVIAVVWQIDVFDLPGIGIIGIEKSEFGEIVIAFLVVIPAFFVDRMVGRQRTHETQLQAAQLSALRATMRTVQDVVSNALMSLYLFRMEAEPHVSAQSLELFDQIIAETAARLKAIADLETFGEKPMAAGMGIAYQSDPSPLKSPMEKPAPRHRVH